MMEQRKNVLVILDAELNPLLLTVYVSASIAKAAKAVVGDVLAHLHLEVLLCYMASGCY